MDQAAVGWYFSKMQRPPFKAPDEVEFHRTKYGRELLIARDAEEFAVAIERLTTIDGLADRLIAGGRERLAADHSPARFAARFSALAERVIGHFGGARGG